MRGLSGRWAMLNHNMSLLGYALLGLLRQEPRSGYDLRKIFATTPLTSFSDSPGSIYPALRRLEHSGLIRSQLQPSSGLRRRRLFRLTAAGRAELERWQKRPIVGDDVIRGVDELMLRFGFMDESLGPAHSLRFLAALERELSGYIPTLRAYLEDHGAHMPLSGRLALESGIIGYESLLRWAQDAIATYENKKEERKRL
jgi:DNA-binding PadR family transcriptional regulator